MEPVLVPPRGFGSNSYLLPAEGGRAVCIDASSPFVPAEAARLGFEVEHVLLTHGHFDHIGGCALFCERGAEISMYEPDVPMAGGKYNMGAEFGCPVRTFPVKNILRGECEFGVSGLRIRFLPTPGHTAGSGCFLFGEFLFSGDTLFAGDIGRCDLPTGNFSRMKESLRLLASLSAERDYRVFPGHGEETTLRAEIARLKQEGLC